MWPGHSAQVCPQVWQLECISTDPSLLSYKPVKQGNERSKKIAERNAAHHPQRGLRSYRRSWGLWCSTRSSPSPPPSSSLQNDTFPSDILSIQRCAFSLLFFSLSERVNYIANSEEHRTCLQIRITNFWKKLENSRDITFTAKTFSKARKILLKSLEQVLIKQRRGCALRKLRLSKRIE